MAEEDDGQQTISSTFPAPPPFWRDFTPDNLARIADLKQERAERENITDPSTLRLDGLPQNLRNLQPPLEPDSGTWRVFGNSYTLVEELPRLDEMGIRKLFPDPEERDQDGKHFDRATILKRLAKSLLLNFLELVGILGISPADAEDKITDIRDLFLNFHHVINEYRPHQARESLIQMMQAQLDRTRAETNAIRDVKEKVERMLEGLSSLKMDSDVPPKLANGTRKNDLTDRYNEISLVLADEYP